MTKRKKVLEAPWKGRFGTHQAGRDGSEMTLVVVNEGS